MSNQTGPYEPLTSSSPIIMPKKPPPAPGTRGAVILDTAKSESAVGLRFLRSLVPLMKRHDVKGFCKSKAAA